MEGPGSPEHAFYQNLLCDIWQSIVLNRHRTYAIEQNRFHLQETLDASLHFIYQLESENELVTNRADLTIITFYCRFRDICERLNRELHSEHPIIDTPHIQADLTELSQTYNQLMGIYASSDDIAIFGELQATIAGFCAMNYQAIHSVNDVQSVFSTFHTQFVASFAPVEDIFLELVKAVRMIRDRS